MLFTFVKVFYNISTNEKRLLSIGYNGAPREFPDEIVPKDSNSSVLVENKNSYMIHSELNAILNYGGSLQDLQGSTLYVTVFPLTSSKVHNAPISIWLNFPNILPLL